VRFKSRRPAAAADWPRYGLARIQWEGPWTKPGVPARVAYRHTHWVGAAWSEARGEFGIFDINAIGNGTGWSSERDWARLLVPWLLHECEPDASGGWYLTHAVEIARDCVPIRPPQVAVVGDGVQPQGVLL